MINNRKNDMSVEREIAKFLDKHLYSDKSIFKSTNRTDTLNEQLQGSDILVSTTDSKLTDAVVDEKVASRYANKNLNTFSLELSFIGRNGNVMPGWFLDEKKTTQYYMLGWINHADIPYNSSKNRYETDLITEDNIKILDWALVSRERIIKELESKGYTLEQLSKIDKAIRNRGYVKTKDFVNGVSFRYSDSYIEQPINILLKKQTYQEIADYSGTINIQ